MVMILNEVAGRSRENLGGVCRINDWKRFLLVLLDHDNALFFFPSLRNQTDGGCSRERRLVTYNTFVDLS